MGTYYLLKKKKKGYLLAELQKASLLCDASLQKIQFEKPCKSKHLEIDRKASHQLELLETLN